MWSERRLGRGTFNKFIISVIVFFLLVNFLKFFSALSSTLLQHSIFEASERMFDDM